eukprot:jgi/Astpho2/7435/e_gw1.00114.101.1_t
MTIHSEGSAGGVKNRAALDATAGAIAGCVARLVVQPLDVLKIRFQVHMHCFDVQSLPLGSLQSKYTGIRQAFVTIVREEGVRGLWRGLLPGQLLTIPYTAVQFATLHQVRAFAQRTGIAKSDWAPSLSFISGALAGAAATAASYPFDLLRTTLAVQGEPKVYRSMTEAAKGIVQHSGVRGLYTGLGITLVEIVPYAALQFGLYDTFTVAWGKARRASESVTGFERFMCGLVAGTLAKLGTHPLDVAKKRYQVAGLQRDLRYGQRVGQETVKTLRTCLTQIYQREGIRGFYKGALPSLIKAAPSAAVTFATYEFVVAYLATLMHEHSNQAQERRRP